MSFRGAASADLAIVVLLAITVGCGQPISPVATSDNRIDVNEAVAAVKRGETDTLDLRGLNVGDAELKLIQTAPSLRSLDLGTGPSRITDQGLHALGNLENLEELILGEASISDQGLEAIAAMKKLRRLNVTGTLVTTAGVRKLAELRNLKSLRLGGSGIDDEALGQLALMTHLETLILVNCPITDRSFEHLRQMTHLKSLYLFGTDVSDERLEELLIILSKATPPIHVHF